VSQSERRSTSTRIAIAYSKTKSATVDITDHCPGVRGKAILKYSLDSQGPTVQLQDKAITGATYKQLHYRYVSLGENLAAQPFFIRFATRWGISPGDLARLVRENAPAQIAQPV